MNDNQPVPNQALREHVTGFAFTLAMPKSAVWALDAIAHGDVNRNRDKGRQDRFICGVRSCEDRGLMVHKHKPSFVGDDRVSGKSINDYYRLTVAGWLVHDLLVEAGLAEAVTSRKQRKLIAA